MRIACLLLGIAAVAHAQTLEGCHRPESGSFLAVACTNCKESDTSLVTAWCYMNPPTTPGGNGFQSTCFCTYSPTDLMMYVPPGTYAVAGSTCDAGWRAVATRWQLTETSGGGDGGCDAPGPAPTPGVFARMLETLHLRKAKKPKQKPPAHVRLGICIVDPGQHHHCTWDTMR